MKSTTIYNAQNIFGTVESTALIKLSNLNYQRIDNVILGLQYAAIIGNIIKDIVRISEVIPRVIKCFLVKSAGVEDLNII